MPIERALRADEVLDEHVTVNDAVEIRENRLDLLGCRRANNIVCDIGVAGREHAVVRCSVLKLGSSSTIEPDVAVRP